MMNCVLLCTVRCLVYIGICPANDLGRIYKAMQDPEKSAENPFHGHGQVLLSAHITFCKLAFQACLLMVINTVLTAEVISG